MCASVRPENSGMETPAEISSLVNTIKIGYLITQYNHLNSRKSQMAIFVITTHNFMTHKEGPPREKVSQNVHSFLNTFDGMFSNF